LFYLYEEIKQFLLDTDQPFVDDEISNAVYYDKKNIIVSTWYAVLMVSMEAYG
jgi:hypothetical protein